MGVLDVVHRVVVRLRLGKLEVELHLAAYRARQEVEPAGVGADFIDNLV